MPTVLDRPFIPSKAEAAGAKQTLEQIQTDKSNTAFYLWFSLRQKSSLSLKASLNWW